MPGYGYEYGHGMGHGAMMMHHGSVLGSLLMIVIAVIVIALALRYLRSGANGRNMGWGCNSSLHTLEERYAKGEINTQEFEERRKVLRGW